MKKWLWVFLLLFLSACLQAPKDIFQEHLNYGESIESHVSFVDVVDLQRPNESRHMVEHRWPQTPMEIIETWAKKITTDPLSEKRLIVMIHQAEVMREDILGVKWYQNDEIKDTLLYRVTFKVEQNHQTLVSRTVSGKAYSQMPAKSSLADQESQWVKMVNQMLDGLTQKGIKQLEIYL